MIELARAPTIIQAMQLIVKLQEGTEECRQVAGAAEFPEVHRTGSQLGFRDAIAARGHDGLHPGPQAFAGLSSSSSSRRGPGER